ncbi:MAG: phosphoribosylaminoimidazolesuccinocarboxamide synthase [Gaiella sp.]
MSDVSTLTHLGSGKVREIYGLDADRLLLVASDRISVFDVVLPTPIPDKGAVLTGLSVFWFSRTRELVPNHLLAVRADGRSLECRRLEMLPVEFVVRGYLAGSGWKDYQATGGVCGNALPPGLREADRLPAPILTPATKAASGAHDLNIDELEASALCGAERYEAARHAALGLYAFGTEHARRQGIVLADTKFEFGVDLDGTVMLADEALTPDSSRLWPASEYAPGASPPSFDKQYVRDYTLSTGWDRTAPGPELPDHVVMGTRRRYAEAFELLTGRPLESYLADPEGAFA